MDKNKKRKLEKAGWKFGDYADFLGLTNSERDSIESYLSMMKKHVDKYNIGQHDKDNTFMWKSTPIEQIEFWRMQNPEYTPIGFCDEVYRICAGVKYIAFVFEDTRGNRYHVHVPEEWKKIVK